MKYRTVRVLQHAAASMVAIGVVYASTPSLHPILKATAPSAVSATQPRDRRETSKPLHRTARLVPASADPCVGTFYVLDSGDFYSVDRNTGATTYVSTLSGLPVPTNTPLNLRYAPDGTLYGRYLGVAGSGRRVIVDIDTGVGTDAGPDVEYDGATLWLPPAYSYEGAVPRGYQSSRNTRKPAEIDSIVPFARHVVNSSLPLAYNFSIGDAVENDGSVFYHITTDAIYSAVLPTWPPNLTLFLQYRGLDISNDAVVTNVDDNREILLVDGVNLYHISTAAKTVAGPVRLPSLNFVTEAIWRPCPFGGVRITPTGGLTTSESGTTSSFTAVLSAAPSSDVTFTLSSSDPNEGTPDLTSLTFTPADWNTPQTVNVTGQPDQSVDGTRPFSIITSATTSSDPNYSGRFVEDVALTNTDIDTAQMQVTPTVSVVEGGAAVPITISLTSRPSADVVVPVSVSNGEATLSAPNVTFTNADWSPRQLLVTAVNDAVDDGDLPFTITIDTPTTSSDPNFAAASPVTVSGTAVDNDTAAVRITASPQPLITTEAGGTATFQVVLDTQPVSDTTVTFTSTDATEATVAPGGETFSSGNWNTPRTITVTGIDDALADGDIGLTITSVVTGDPLYAAITPAAVSVVNADDETPTLSIAPASATEGQPVVFHVTMSRPAIVPVSVTYATSDGTAGASDYTTTTGTLNFAVGVTSQPVSVPTTADAIYEGDETFTATLSSAVNGSIAAPSAAGTITDAQLPPGMSIAAASAQENTGSMLFTVSLASASGLPASATWTTSAGTATPGVDYTESTGTVLFPAGSTTQTFTVPLLDDTTPESGETFHVALSGLSGATTVAPSSTGSILDDDGQLSISPTSAVEGQPLVFTATLTPAAEVPVTVQYATSDGTADSADYTSASGTLNFAPGDASKSFSVATTTDSFFESAETVTTTLSVATNAVIATGSAAGTITNDDPLPSMSIADAFAPETDPTIIFSVTLDRASAFPATANWSTSNGSATAGHDYTAASGVVTFPPGVTSQNITVGLLDDTDFDPSATFTVTLTGAVNASLTAATGTATLADDEGPPTITVSPTSAVEGQPLLFTVTLTPHSPLPVSVQYSTSNGTASAGDYTAGSGTVSLAPGTTAATITVPTLQDALHEDAETVVVNLHNVVNSGLATNSSVGTILDDDDLPLMSIEDTSAPRNAGFMDFTVTLSPVSGTSASATWTTVAGTADDGDDFVGTTGTVTFPAGVTRQTIRVPLVDNSLSRAGSRATSRGNRGGVSASAVGGPTFQVVLSAAAGATLSRAAATAVILPAIDSAGIPTLNGWMLLALTLSLAVAATVALRR